MRYFIIAGEASGDLHGANLIKGIQHEDPAANFQVWGGDLMQATGATLLKHYRELAFMGFIEVVKNLSTILNNFKICKKSILDFKPDVLILIDYPGFNLRMAKWAKANNIKVFYYISPQIWAWHSSRVHGIKATIDRMFVILPFEKDFYKKYNYEVDFVGHPLLDVLENFEVDTSFKISKNNPTDKVIALLPGSRKQEISRMLDIMLSLASDFPTYHFVIAGAPSIPTDFYKENIAKYNSIGNIQFVTNKTYDLLSIADAALVTSGTATLETGLFGVPQIVCYKGSPTSYYIARKLVNIKYISLVNLILDRPAVHEMIQDELTSKNLKAMLPALLSEQGQQKAKAQQFKLNQQLGRAGASKRTAQLMVESLKAQAGV